MSGGTGARRVWLVIAGFVAVTAVFLVVLLLAGERPMRVGSKKFTESVVLGEVLKLLIESVGEPCEHLPEMGGSYPLTDDDGSTAGRATVNIPPGQNRGLEGGRIGSIRAAGGTPYPLYGANARTTAVAYLPGGSLHLEAVEQGQLAAGARYVLRPTGVRCVPVAPGSAGAGRAPVVAACAARSRLGDWHRVRLSGCHIGPNRLSGIYHRAHTCIVCQDPKTV